jgi:hypothetical protein
MTEWRSRSACHDHLQVACEQVLGKADGQIIRARVIFIMARRTLGMTAAQLPDCDVRCAAEGQMMTVPEITQHARNQAEASAAGPAAEVLERLAERLGGKASVSAVFGEPVERAGITIIPVAKVGFGFGAGTGRASKEAEISQGGGGGGGASATPVGYIEIKDGNAVFKPIRDPLVDVVVPLVTLVAGFAAPRLMRRMLRRR